MEAKLQTNFLSFFFWNSLGKFLSPVFLRQAFFSPAMRKLGRPTAADLPYYVEGVVFLGSSTCLPPTVRSGSRKDDTEKKSASSGRKRNLAPGVPVSEAQRQRKEAVPRRALPRDRFITQGAHPNTPRNLPSVSMWLDLAHQRPRAALPCR